MELSVDGQERDEIREELSKMSFKDLQKLKSKLGSKAYNEAVFGVKTVKNEFKRANKNRPRELSSKKVEPVVFLKRNKVEVRDPRFDELCGTFSTKKFKEDYEFLDKFRHKEKAKLIKKLKQEDNLEERRKIRSLLQRIGNKEKNEEKKRKKEEKTRQEVEEKVQALKEGRKPYFRSKLENKVADLVEQYSELKSKGKLLKHIEKKRKKVHQKEKKKGTYEELDL